MNLVNWDRIEEERLNPLLYRKVIHGGRMTVARMRLLKGVVVPVHHHANEQICMLQSGRLRFVVNGEECVLGPGDVLRLAPDAPHMAEALEDSIAVDLFSPVREDWIRGDDNYLRK